MYNVSVQMDIISSTNKGKRMLPEKTLEDTLKIAGAVSNLYVGSAYGGSELIDALKDFAQEANVPWILIGGIAVGFHSKPRGTQDIDVIVAGEEDINKLKNSLKSFKHNRSHAFEHKKTGVEVEVLTADFLNINTQIAEKALTSSVKQTIHGIQIPVADSAGLIALKLERGERQDLADIEGMLKKDISIDLSEYSLSEDQKEIFNDIKKDVKNKE